MTGKSVALSLLLLTLVCARTAQAGALEDAAERYRPYAIEGIRSALSGARDLRERIAAKDLAGARKAWLSARAGWERSEVFTAGFVPELDALIDAWPNADSGFHTIEAKLFGEGRVGGRSGNCRLDRPRAQVSVADRDRRRRRHRAGVHQGRTFARIVVRYPG